MIPLYKQLKLFIMQLITPKLRFALYLVDQTKFKNNQQGSYVVCYADTYEIKEDGSITFFQTGNLKIDGQNKKVKVPAISYPNGKWEACVLIGDNGSYPIFSGKVENIETLNPSPVQAKIHQSSNSPLQNNNSNDELDMFDHSNDNSSNPPWKNNNNNNYNSNNVSTMGMNNMPGVGQNNTAEFKKVKNDFLEQQIKEYLRDVLNNDEKFDIPSFQTYANKEARNKNIGKISETDIEWVASNLIRDKAVLTRYFADTGIQKILSLDLKDLMKRQWAGKMGPILQVLKEKEATKNVTAIDIAVWMVQNKFEQ